MKYSQEKWDMSGLFPVKKIPAKKWKTDLVAGRRDEYIILRRGVISKMYCSPGNFPDTRMGMHFAMPDLVE